MLKCPMCGGRAAVTDQDSPAFACQECGHRYGSTASPEQGKYVPRARMTWRPSLLRHLDPPDWIQRTAKGGARYWYRLDRMRAVGTALLEQGVTLGRARQKGAY